MRESAYNQDKSSPHYRRSVEVRYEDANEKLNLTMLCDFYELTMGNGYFQAGMQDRITYFDVFFRNVPDNGGFAVCAGLEQLIALYPEPAF